MSVPTITAVRLTGAANRAELPLLVLGPSIGTSASTLWTECAAGLTDAFDVVAWDLPGHGYNHTVPDESFTMSELAQGVLNVRRRRSSSSVTSSAAPSPTRATRWAAVSASSCCSTIPVGCPSAVLLCTGAKIGEPAMWAGRIGQVSVSGYVGPGLRRPPSAGSARASSNAPPRLDRRCCTRCRTPTTRATSRCARRSRSSTSGTSSARSTSPCSPWPGSADVATPPENLSEIAEGVQHGQLVELDDVAHLAPAEAPTAVARLIRQHVLGETEPGADEQRGARRTTRGWPFAARCSVMPTWTGPPPAPPTSPVSSRSSSPSTPGAASGPVPASTAAAAR